MKKMFLVFLVVSALGLVFSSCTKAQAQSRPDRWEYTLLRSPLNLERFNELGGEGWELVTITFNANGGWGSAFFKRKL